MKQETENVNTGNRSHKRLNMETGNMETGNVKWETTLKPLVSQWFPVVFGWVAGVMFFAKVSVNGL